MTLPLLGVLIRNRFGTVASRAKIPPSPLWSALMTKVRYFTVTTMKSDQNISDRIPKRSATVALVPPAACRHSFNVYSGLVPISPKTTPSAPSISAARLPPWPGPCAVVCTGGDLSAKVDSSTCCEAIQGSL